MSLLALTVDDLRCIEHAYLELHPDQNLIWGGNGSGKTSLLEAIFLLGRGRSFRTRNSERLIRYGQDRLVVFGRSGSRAANLSPFSYDAARLAPLATDVHDPAGALSRSAAPVASMR